MDQRRGAEIESRWKAFRLLAPFFGRVVSARFIQRTSEAVSEIARVHNLIEGIYKPKDAYYAFAIASMLKNPYADRITYLSDRSWSFHYSAKSGSLDSAVNSSLFHCLQDHEPVVVLKQLSDKQDPVVSRNTITTECADFQAVERVDLRAISNRAPRFRTFRLRQ